MLTLTPIAAFVVAFVIAVALTPITRRFAVRYGVLDRTGPDKLHAREVPRIGGVAIAIAFFVPVCVLSLRVNLYATAVYADPRRIGAILVGGFLILVLGVYDDLRGAWAWQKLLVQVPVAMLTWAGGVRIAGTLGVHAFVEFSALVSLVVTTGFIVLVINAVNLLDGLDGLASGVALEVLVAGAICAGVRGEPVLVLLCLCLAGSVAGFLVFNFSPASIFMGDSGSMFIGYVLGTAAIWSSQKGITLVGAVLPVIALGLPLLDTALAMVRRAGASRSILRGDLDHVHHRLLKRGWSERSAVLALYGVGFFFAGLSVLLVFVETLWIARALAAVSVIVALVVARWLGYLRGRASRAR